MKHTVLRTLALAALLMVPLVGHAQGGCTIKVVGHDSYGDGWNGGQLTVTQGSNTLSTWSGPADNGYTSGGVYDTLTLTLTSDDPVTFSWSTGSYGSEVTIWIYDGGDIQVFTVNNPSAGTIFTLNTPCPTCLPPTGLTVSNILTDEITLSWTAPAGATQYAVYVNGALENGNVTGTSYTFNGLNASTSYTFGVQNICSSTDSSSIATRSARTTCGDVTLPFTEGFEDAEFNGAWYPCWDSTIHAGTDPSVNNNTVHTGTYSMYLQATSSESYNLVVGPSMNATGDNIYVRFWANMASSTSGWLKAGVITNPYDTTTFIPLVTVEGVSGWNEYEFNTATLDPMANYRIAWLAYRSVSYNSRIACIDDIYVSEIPSCQRITDLTVIDSLTDSSSITIEWVDPNAGGTFNLRYWAATGDTVEISGLTSTTYTITDLQANTAYTFEVTVVCGSEEAESVIVMGRTACGNLTLPFVEGFEDEGALSCWQVINPEYNTGRSTYAAHTGSASFLFWYTYNPPEYLISPQLSGTDGGVAVEFWYKRYSSSYSESFQVGFSSTSDSVEAFAWETEVTDVNDEFQLYSTIFPAGTKYVAIKYTANNAYGVYIDDINFMLPPDCSPISMLTFDTATATTATIHWTAGEGQSAWYVKVGDDVYDASETTYTINGLDPLTPYTVYVAANCGGDTSDWRSVSFNTGCAGEECEITVISSDSYGYSFYCPTLQVVQNGVELASVNSETRTIGVCSSMPVNIIYQAPTYSGSTTSAIVRDGGDAEVFNGSTDAFSTGDTIITLANPCPTCITPNDVLASVVDSAMITFTWPAMSGYTYLTSFNGGPYTVNNSGAQTEYNLDANTVYTFSVKVVCSLGDTSSPRTITQKTSCGQMVIPYFTDFEYDTDNEAPSCWMVVNGTPTVSDYAYYAYSGNQSLVLGMGEMIASSAIPLSGDSIYVSFYMDAYYGPIEVGMMTNPLFDTTFTPILTINGTNDYEFFELNTSTLSTDSTYYLAFRNNSPYSYYDAYIEDVTIRHDEGCMYPSSLTATPDTVSTQVILNWVNNGSSTEFVVEYRESSGTWSSPIYVPGITTYTLNSLSYSTTYEIRVGLVCGNDTLWTSTTVTTPCSLMTLPYTENFVSATGELPPCWDYTNSTYFHWNRWTTHAEYSGDGELMVGSYSAGEAAILPAFMAPLIKLEISFDAKVGNVSEGDGIMMGAYNPSTGLVDWIDTLTNPGQCRENFVRFTYNYLSYLGSGTRIAIGHSHNNSNDWGMALDSIVVIELANCNPPENVTAHNTLYPNTADDIYFTWTVADNTYTPSSWQIYIDTITSTIDIDSVPESQLITVDTTYYMPPINALAEGAHYRFFVRGNCGSGIYSGWVELQNGFATDEYWMNNTGTADTIVGCDFIIYDNGGPVAGYLHNSNSTVVIQAGEAGRELQLQGAFFSHGADANTFTVYDGIGTDGAVLYTRSMTDTTETIDSILATSTTSAMTITFTSGYYAALGYELYIHCVGEASCERPTNLQVEMIGVGQALATWDSTGASFYRVYHHVNGDSVWNMHPTTTNSITLSGLPADVTYDFYVVAYCSATDTSAPSIIRHFSTHYEEPICDPVTGLSVSDIGQTVATIGWTSDGTLWEIEFNGVVISTTDNPCTLSGLTANTDYNVRVRNVCDAASNFYSEWTDVVTFHTDTIPIEGIDEVDGMAALALYPNPASATVTIDIQGVDGMATVSLIDLNGRTCGNWKVESDQLVIDLRGFARGAYFVRVTGENTSIIRKLVLR
ncbi:MAG: fibronectin type III domain-containing protein [Bacteroidales bacterium]|nr:fibronectin type III domain-containing protein [Bacteroidales bacterium]